MFSSDGQESKGRELDLPPTTQTTESCPNQQRPIAFLYGQAMMQPWEMHTWQNLPKLLKFFFLFVFVLGVKDHK